MRKTLIGALVASSALAGCSFATMKKPPSPLSPATPPECTSSRTPVIADVAAFVAGSTLGLLFIISGAVAEIDGDGDSQAKAGTLLTVASIPFAVSAGYGLLQSGRCRRAKQTWGVMYGPQPAPWPAQPAPLPAAQPPAPGAERGACRATEPTCEPGLTCASHQCVRLP